MRQLREKERDRFEADLLTSIRNRMNLKTELATMGKSLRDEIKRLDERVDHIAAVLQRGQIEEDDVLLQMTFEEAPDA